MKAMLNETDADVMGLLFFTALVGMQPRQSERIYQQPE
jgi:hypothetical protein